MFFKENTLIIIPQDLISCDFNLNKTVNSILRLLLKYDMKVAASKNHFVKLKSNFFVVVGKSTLVLSRILVNIRQSNIKLSSIISSTWHAFAPKQ